MGNVINRAHIQANNQGHWKFQGIHHSLKPLTRIQDFPKFFSVDSDCSHITYNSSDT